jgi:hypothetical protein
MAQFAVRYGDQLVHDASWVCISDVIASFHGGFAEGGMVTGVLVTRAGDGEEWEEIA